LQLAEVRLLSTGERIIDALFALAHSQQNVTNIYVA